MRRVSRGRPGGRLRRSSGRAPVAARSPAASPRRASRWWRSMPAPTSAPSRTSPPTRLSQSKLYWTDERICDGDEPAADGLQQLRQGGRRLHRPFRHGVAALPAGMVQGAHDSWATATDWPLDWREMWGYYAQVENALKISGPVTYPWGPETPALPLPRAPVERGRARAGARAARNSAIRLVRDAARHRLGPARRESALRVSRLLHARLLHQCQAERAGDLAAARARGRRRDPRPRHGGTRSTRTAAGDRVTGVHYCPRTAGGASRRRGNVVVAGYAIETPRLLLMSATNARHPDGLANSSGLVGKYLTVQGNQAVWGQIGRRDPLLQGAAFARPHRTLELRGSRARISTAATAG